MRAEPPTWRFGHRPVLGGAAPNWCVLGGSWSGVLVVGCYRPGIARIVDGHARVWLLHLLRRLWVSAWTSEAEDQVHQHAGGPRGLLDGGRWPGAVVRLWLDHRSSRAAGAVFLQRLYRAAGRAVHRDPLRQARVRPVGPGRD